MSNNLSCPRCGNEDRRKMRFKFNQYHRPRSMMCVANSRILGRCNTVIAVDGLAVLEDSS
jgi:hypothetical protein